MPQYEVLADSYLNGRIYKAGETVDYDGVPHASNLRPVDSQAKKAASEVKAVSPSATQLVELARLHAASRGADPATQTDATDVAAVIEPMPSYGKPNDATIKQAMAIITGDASSVA